MDVAMPKRYFSRVSPFPGVGICTRVTRTVIPPAVQAAASLLLATLWGFAVFGDWGIRAFCEASPARSPECADRIASVIAVSVMIAVVAVCATGTAWLARRESLYGVAVAAWGVALVVLFVGGLVAQ
ncbi:hypothetical protein GCM10010116_41900 [Microbispora rosea subsp. aerata]|nr:hypothetical protein GCM10010116_41900 [Microbispora rosea subsp. aerata]GIH56087.1 hypothetical protein Mro02_30010 [Microbispora rosea subsp. aerata]GLJ85652.1 hypothetical protein GCM10017588_43850 [Microbispora rosea subsp. aerata]